ncbi:hypothetical protein PAPYR_12395 [Paratrimastix pyriformis]|uniref:Uncharacterized protein n=1 Tax=Paratrimastix pyriformis TaxID=342808 RepID=A0ABQ8U7A0_9EUKA|nr:hypothetical protein PAPYR_12395 [Paratrimastix pyriformis]
MEGLGSCYPRLRPESGVLHLYVANMYDTHTHTLLQEEKMLRGSCGLLELDWLGWVFPRLNSVDFTEKKFELGDVELTWPPCKNCVI